MTRSRGESLRLALLRAVFRRAVKPVLARAEDPVAMRALFERAARRTFTLPPYALLLSRPLAPGLRALWISVRPAARPVHPRRLVLYFHGGAFVVGSPETHSAMLARLSRLTGIEVVAPAWRLAPEHPFPAGNEDARRAFDALLARGYRPEDIVIGGDSAGGNIALGLLAGLLADGLRPAGVFALSPVTDLGFSGASIRENAARDPMLPINQASRVDGLYLHGVSADDPRASPLFARFDDPPPVFFQVSETEVLRDDSLRLADKLRAAGGRVSVDLWPDAPHVFAIFARYVPEARVALGRVAQFVSGCFDAVSLDPRADQDSTGERAASR